MSSSVFAATFTPTAGLMQNFMSKEMSSECCCMCGAALHCFHIMCCSSAALSRLLQYHIWLHAAVWATRPAWIASTGKCLGLLP